MKQYLLLLKSGDFNKVDNLWTSNAINLYKNNSYTNYSYTRSRYGLNTIGDNTYVGLELTSPSYAEELSTPLLNNTVYVTDVGEIAYDEATPSLLRFVDTTSKTDILAYRHAFTNLPGIEVPTFNIQIYESDSEEGPWLKSTLSFDSNVIFIRDSKPWIKVELEIFAESLNLNDIGLLFYLEIGIHDPIPAVISERTRNILKRFPTWTDLFSDSEEPATPSLYVPDSVGGKVLTALTQESLDNFDNELNIYDINHYIASADVNMLAWAYVCYDVPVNILKVLGDDVQLIQADSLSTLYRSKSTDYIYYYSQINKQIITLREFESIKINGNEHDQYPLHIPNNFDEFGARVGLPRLFLESNERYRKRILDVSKNVPASNIDGFKRTVRRELDIWKAYGLEPDSDYLGATPDVIEISDMEKTTPWFTASGKPLKPFLDLVESLNERYPSNLGYVRWNEGYWDYSGIEGDGISYIPAIYDVETSTSPDYYQPGVGDYADGKLILEADEKSTISFSGYSTISGVYEDGTEDIYTPIKMDYSWYLSYLKNVPDFLAGRINESNGSYVGVGFTYEVELNTHDQYTTPTTLYTNLSYLDREDFYVGNRFSENHPSSPEYNLIKIFNDDGYTLSDLQFRDKTYNNLYYNQSSSPSVNTVNFEDVSSVKIVFSNGGWNYISQDYDLSLATANYRAAFSQSSPNLNYHVNPEYPNYVQLSSPNMNYTEANIYIGSNVYATKSETFNTPAIRSSFYLNDNNDLSSSGLQGHSVSINGLIDRLIFPSDSTPQYLYINSVKPTGLTYFNGDSVISDTHGGIMVNPYDSEPYFVPSSPNIIYSSYDSSENQLSSGSYFDSATINYSATPDHLYVESATNSFYPIYYTRYSTLSAQTTPDLFTGYIDSLDNVYTNDEQVPNTFFNSDDFLQNIYLSKDSFGLDSNIDYTIKDIQFVADTNYVEPFVNDKNSLIQDVNYAFLQNGETEVGIRVKKDIEAVVQNNPAIHTGWIYVDNEEYYIYSNPVVDSATGQFFSLKLSQYPRSGAPFIVSVGESNYRNIAIEDSATPGLVGFSNIENIYGNISNSLYLSYENVENVSVKDAYTGITLFDNLSTETNKLDCFSDATPAVYGRSYTVSYDVVNGWYVDKNVYAPEEDSYQSVIYFSSTPNTSEVYSITYESSLNDTSHSIELEMNSSDLPIDEGYVYLSKSEYSFKTAEIKLSPSNISNSLDDIMYVTITSYDQNNNFKPGQTFRIYGDLVAATPEYVTTNNNGIANAIVRYAYSGEELYENGNIYVSGVGSATPNGDPNSQSENFNQSVPFEISIPDAKIVRLKAAPSALIINAGSDQSISLLGQIFWKDKLWQKIVPVSWNKARTLKDLFAATPDYVAYTLSNGSFTIPNIATAQDVATPGYWFARVNISDTDYVNSQLVQDGEISASEDVNVSGDVVYWYESYDTIQYSQELSVPLPNIYTSNRQPNSNIIATPNFVYKHNDGNTIIYNDATPNWIPPRWVPLTRYDQYQMGILGSTPNYISDRSALHPDHEEE